ncbi:MAG TPA: ACT domain-containing protein [Patescibacteria group bacterium]|nr:ACT domain-containing protein [Patescibacteria group bacterium]
MAKQLNIFVENRPGRVKSIAEALCAGNINIKVFTIQDRGDFGLMKIIADKPEAAYLLLAEKGFASAQKEILAISVKDKPGNLARLTGVLLEHKINILDAHGDVVGTGKQGICYLELDLKDLGVAKGLLEKEGFHVLSDEELYEI